MARPLVPTLTTQPHPNQPPMSTALFRCYCVPAMEKPGHDDVGVKPCHLSQTTPSFTLWTDPMATVLALVSHPRLWDGTI